MCADGHLPCFSGDSGTIDVCMKKGFSIAGLAAVLTGFLCAVQGADDSGTNTCRIVKVQGEVWVGEAQGLKSKKAATLNDLLPEGEYLHCGKGALAELEFSDSTSARLGPLSKFHYSVKTSSYVLDQGEAIFSFAKGKGGFVVSTPAIAVRIEGTTVYVKVTRNLVEYACLEGRCRIGPHTLTSGEKLVLRGSATAYSAPKQRLKVDDFLKNNLLVGSFEKPLPQIHVIQEESRKQK